MGTLPNTDKRKYNPGEGISAVMNQDSGQLKKESLRVTTEFGQVESYDSVVISTFLAGVTDYDLRLEPNAFKNVIHPRTITIRTDREISAKIKSNDVIGDAIPIGPGDSPFEMSFIEIQEVYLTNDGADNAYVKILLV